MASKETWAKVAPYFKPDSKYDSWGDPDLIDDEFLLALYDFRVFVSQPVMITHAVKTSGHSYRSYHYPENGACAADVILPLWKGSVFDLILTATRFGFTGIGYYPHWMWRGKVKGGLHLDRRPLRWDSDGTLNYSHSRWLGVPGKNGQDYIAMTAENIFYWQNKINPSLIQSLAID